MRIHIHSVVDVITNSSTVIYTRVTEGALELVEQMIDAVLTVGGSRFQASDLFEFSVRKEYCGLDDEYYLEELRWEAMYRQYPDFRNLSDSAKNELFDAHKQDPPRWWSDPEELGLRVTNTYIEVTALDVHNQDAADLLSKLHALFESEESWE